MVGCYAPDDGDEQAAFLAEFIFGVLDDLVVSSKLLMSGKMIASGDLMRQAIEGVAVAILCSSRQPVFVSRGRRFPATLSNTAYSPIRCLLLRLSPLSGHFN